MKALLHEQENRHLHVHHRECLFSRQMPLAWTKDENLHHVMYMSATDRWSFRLCSTKEKLFLIGLVNRFLQPASNQVETVEKAFECSCDMTVACERNTPKIYRISTEIGWKSVLPRHVNCINSIKLWLESLIPKRTRLH